MKLSLSTLCAGAFAGMSLIAESQAAHALAGRAEGPVRIDGRLDEPFWKTCPLYGDFQPIANWPERKLPLATHFRVARDEDHVYFGIYCEDPVPASPKPKLPRGHAGVFRRDLVEIFLDPTGLGQSYYQLGVTRHGDLYDNYWVESGMNSLRWSGRWQAAAVEAEGEWTVEIALPIASLSLTEADTMRSEWRFNVTRTYPSADQYASWSPVVRSFHDPDFFRFLGNMPVRVPSEDVGIQRVELEAYPGIPPVARVELRTGPAAGGPVRIKVATGEEGKGTTSVDLLPGIRVVPLILEGTVEDAGQVEMMVDVVRGDRLLASRLVRTRPRRDRLKIVLQVPGPTGILAWDETVTAVQGTIEIGGPVSEKDRLHLRLEAPGLDGPVEQVLPADLHVPFQLPIGKMKEGRGKLIASLRSGEGVLAETHQTLRKVGPPPAGPFLRVDNHGRLLVDGTPHFFLDLYAPYYNIASAIAKRLNGVSGWLNANVPGTRSPFQTWNLEPERIGRNIPGFDPVEVTRDERPSDAMLARVREIVQSNVRQGGFAFWYLCDEPEYRSVSPVYLKHLYDLVKELDPWHPVLLTTTAPEIYGEVTDIVACHPYIAPSFLPDGTRRLYRPVRRSLEMTRRAIESNGGKRLVVSVPQCFAYTFASVQADYPTHGEYQASLWLPIAAGANGLWPFLGNGMFAQPHLRHGTRFAFESLRSLEPILLQAGSSLPINIEPEGSGVVGRLHRQGESVLLILVNAEPVPIEAKVRAEALKACSMLKVFRAGRTVSLTDGALTYHFAPYEVLVVGHQLPEQGLPTEEEWLAEQAAAEADRIRPGNLLYGRGRWIQFDANADQPGRQYNLSAQIELFDGIRDSGGWRVRQGARSELTFPEPVRIGRLVIHGWALDRLAIVVNGTPAEVRVAPDGSRADVIWKGEAPVRSIRMDAGGTTMEIYEVEGYAP